MHESLQCPNPKPWGRCGSKLCKPCNNWRRMKWIYRLEQENLVTPRTWFLTLTSSSTLVQDEWRHSWQKYMKKVRKSLTARNVDASKRQLRYFAVQELGKKNSRRHLHALIYCSDTLTRRELENHWNLGFSNCKLVQPTHIRYVAKYIGKDTHRIMASQLLGLRAGIPSADGHPMWYLNMRWKRLTRSQKPTLTVLQQTNQDTNGLDCMERTMPSKTPHKVGKPDSKKNVISLDSEGPRRGPDFEGTREAQT